MHDRIGKAKTHGSASLCDAAGPGFALRFGRADDLPFIVAMIRAAGAGLFEAILDQAVAGVDPATLLTLAVGDDASPFFYENTIVAILDRQPAGMVLACDGDAPLLSADLLALVPVAVQERFGVLLNPALPDAIYIAAIAVDPDARRAGCAMTLLRAAGELAVAQGYARAGLHVRSDNHAALRLYERAGFVRSAPPALVEGIGEVWTMTASAGLLARVA